MATLVPPDAVVAAATDQVSCDLAGDAAILHLGTGTYYTLDGVGARIWTLLQRPVTLATLHQTLLAEYDVTPERLDADLQTLLQALRAAGLIEIQRADAA
ncbi:MAG: PqqD family protein [Burkholderiales bacterium]